VNLGGRRQPAASCLSLLPIYNVKDAIWAHALCGAILRFVNGKKGVPAMKRYVIERNLPGVGQLNGEQLKGAAATSNGALEKLPGKVQWVQSYVTDDKTFCVYLAESEAAVQEHARLSGFPANKITEVRTIIDPMTGQA
jgi:Nickel responsive protein SCO4226-like